jgi:hypothetical protein
MQSAPGPGHGVPWPARDTERAAPKQRPLRGTPRRVPLRGCSAGGSGLRPSPQGWKHPSWLQIGSNYTGPSCTVRATLVDSVSPLCRDGAQGSLEWVSGGNACERAHRVDCSGSVSSLFVLGGRGVGAAAPIQMRLPGCVYVNAPGGEGDESRGRHLLSSGNSNRMRLLLRH